MFKQRTYSPYALEACQLLGKLIQLGRKNKHWTAQDLADRAGITRVTLHKIENGEMTCAIGLIFEVAALVGVPLFASNGDRLTERLAQINDKLALLPKNIYPFKKVVDDEF